MKDAISLLEKFVAQYKPYLYQKKTLLIEPEENLINILYLKEGYVRMYLISEKGKELTLNIFKPGSYFPMTWAIGEMINNYYYETMTEVKICKIPKDEMLSLLNKEPAILFDLTRRIIIGLNAILTRMEYLLFGNAYNRVASTILLSGKRFGLLNQKGEIEINLPLTHQEIANLSSLTREATTIEMDKLTKNGLITTKKRKIIIKDLNKLEELSKFYSEEERNLTTL